MSTVASTLSQNKFSTRDFTPTNIDNMIYYEQVFSASYTASTDGENPVSFPDVPVGARMINVERNIKPLFNNQWSWNSTSRILTLLALPVTSPDDIYSVTLSQGETLSYIYSIIRTSI